MNSDNTFTVHPASHEDVSSIMEIIDLAKEDMRNSGSDQWQNGKPNADMIHADIDRGHSFVLVDSEDTILGTAYICTEADPTYAVIEQGTWRSSSPYTVMHRVAVRRSFRGHGLAGQLLQYAMQVSRSDGTCHLRIDTHEKNIPMQHFLERNGFSRRGIIQTPDGSRLAYDCLLESSN